MPLTSSKQQNKNGNKAGLHPNSLANLKPIMYQPGQSGNAPGFSLTSRLKWALSKALKDGKFDPETIGDEIVLATITGAKRREPAPFRELWDRCEGKQADKSTLSGKVEIIIRWDGNRPDQSQG